MALARVLAVLAVLWPAAAAQAQAPSFTASLDRAAVPLDDTLTYEVTLSASGGDDAAEGYQAPDFKGLRVLSQRPSESTQIQMGPGGSSIQHVYVWHYELSPTRKGNVTIGPARVRVGGRELRTQAVVVAVGDPTGRGPSTQAPPPRQNPFDPFGMFEEPPPTRPATPAPGSRLAFLRVVPDKLRATVGEQVTVTWYLYVDPGVRPNKYQTVAEPKLDAFWTEDLPAPSMTNGLALTAETYEGRSWEVAVILKRALFPLQAGRQVIGPMEAEIAQVDFFRGARSQRLKADPVALDVTPLPPGAPPGFEPANVGRYTLSVRADRTQVGVGEAVTVTVEARGQGNVRNLRLPRLPALDGWKAYEPRSNVTIEPGDAVGGAKTMEVLLLPERAGVGSIPALEMSAFDPVAGRYQTARSEPLRLEASAAPGASATALAAPGAPPSGVAVENVLPAEIRSIHARATLRRDLGATFYRTDGFLLLLALPPLAFVLTALAGRLRVRMAADTESARRRRVRRLIKERLGAAEAHRSAGRTSEVFIEIERVLREVLAARLGRPVTGLRLGELRALMAERAMPAELAARVVAEIEACDERRFAPGALSEADLGAALERAGDIIVAVQKARMA